MAKPRHGHAFPGAKSKTYMIWTSMRQRCENSAAKDFPRYGGRGITVCERWKSFEAFLADMGEAPRGMSLERRDNEGPYCKDNCEWATRSTQQRNTRRARKYVVNGVELNVCQIEKNLGLSQGAVWHRIQSGWSVERAITEGKS
jgi:hypothetical protein